LGGRSGQTARCRRVRLDPLKSRFDLEAGAIVGDGRGGSAGVELEAGREELGGGGQVGGDLVFKNRTRDLVDYADRDRGGIRRGGDEEREHTAGGDREARPDVDQRRRAGAIVVGELSAGMGAAPETIPMQLTTALSVSVVASAAVEP